MVIRLLLAFAWAVALSDGFNRPAPLTRQAQAFSSPTIGTPIYSSPLFRSQLQVVRNDLDENDRSPSLLRRVMDRFDTTESAGLEDVKFSGIGKRIKGLHGPITYLILAGMVGLKWKWCFKNPYYWFAVAFCVKWYRARYVFKIPVWDRQPNWNNIITSKEQEKDLKAFTCKNCGSTLFIAKTREFFFEGNTGIGGLGCFSCGVKGKENFIQDRDRIVEDVADTDDYFEYERPLDFVSAAERRQLLKEAGGDEEAANKLLVAKSEDSEEASSEKVEASEVLDVEASEVVDAEEPVQAEPTVSEVKPKKKKKKKSSKKKVSKKPIEEPPSDDFDALGMDDF